jgi:thioredoxin-related protein
MKRIVLIVGVLILVLFTVFFLWRRYLSAIWYSDGDNAKVVFNCEQDQRMCPDGSYVFRSGPDCTFGQCPEINENSIVVENLPGAYVPYRDTWNLDKNDKNGNIFLVFSLKGCESCSKLAKNIEDNAISIPFSFWILNVDIEKYPNLYSKYNITKENTILQIDNNGSVIKSFYGLVTLKDLVKQVEK